MESKKIDAQKPPAKSVLKKKKKSLTAKQKIIKESAEHRQRMQQLQFSWQEEIFSTAQVKPALLRQAAALLQPHTYDEIVEERVVQNWCGYPLCDRAPLQNTLSKYHISLSRRKVYDQSELASFCSEECMQKSKYFRMQLSEDPVWIRDRQATPDIHIVLMNQDLKHILAKQEQERNRIKKKNAEQIRRDYVQQLLTNVPLKAAWSGKEIEPATTELTIVEKTSADRPSIVTKRLSGHGAHNSIEGYCVDIHRSGNKPGEETTMILKPKSKPNVTSTTQPLEKKTLDLNDEEAVHEDAMETMMRLKSMKLDVPQEAEKNVPSTPEPQPHAHIKSEKQQQTRQSVQKSETRPDITIRKQTLPPVEHPAPASNSIKTIGPIAPPKVPPTKKKKRLLPEMSLFGKVWTVTDRITTRATRRYLEELGNSRTEVDVRSILCEDNQHQSMQYDENSILRSQLFSDKILETYTLACTQIGFGNGLRKELINLMQTFQFVDPSLAALDSVQAYMMSLVLFKALADSTSTQSGGTTDWQPAFEACCKAIDQSTDTINACVRVLRVAST
ncbi:Rtr1/RPAP2 family-domain-containing protein [Dichotomocladium elegans]|nr:Rtr1/RPAP2 family-domain-containing protein [Dichotomocladium elegans]